jgi:hypothetical protein
VSENFDLLEAKMQIARAEHRRMVNEVIFASGYPPLPPLPPLSRFSRIAGRVMAYLRTLRDALLGRPICTMEHDEW